MIENRNVYTEREKLDTGKLLSQEFSLLGCRVKKIGDVWQSTKNGKICFFYGTETSYSSQMAYRILKNKDLAKKVLRDIGVSVATGHRFGQSEKELAFEKLKEIGLAVVKPVDGNKGQGVSVEVTVENFDAAWSTAFNFTSKGILLEKYFENGKEARYLVIDGVCVAVSLKSGPSVRGNGVDTIGQLVDQINQAKENDPTRRNRLINFDARRLDILESQGYNLGSIPPNDKVVSIDWKTNTSTGGDARDITFEVHDSMKKIVEKIAREIPGLDVLGVDLMATDHSVEATPNNYIIVEANTRPAVQRHQFPDFGQPINVAKLIAENCLRHMENGTRSSDIISRNILEPIEVMSPIARKARVSLDPPNDKPTESAADTFRKADPSPEGQITLVFGGDTSLGDAYLEKAKTQKYMRRLQANPLSFFEKLMPLVCDKSHFLVNFESVLSDSPTGPLDNDKKYLGWDQPERSLDMLKKIGVDTVSLANNHTMDFGPDRLVETISHLKQAGINVFGAGQNIKEASRPLKLTTSLGNIYLLAGYEVRAKYRDDFNFYATKSSPGVNPFRQRQTNQISKSIERLRSKDPSSLIIAYPHWGGASNYQWATERMFEVNSSFLAAGADLVLGHGAHMVQQCEATHAGSTVFSLGNFVFNSPGRYEKKNAPPYSLVARLQLQRNPLWTGTLALYPIVSDNKRTGYRPRPVKEAEAIELFGLLDMKSRPGFQKEFSLEKDDRGWYFSRSFTIYPKNASLQNSII